MSKFPRVPAHFIVEKLLTPCYTDRMEPMGIIYLKKLLELITSPKNKLLLSALSAILLYTPQQQLTKLGLAHIADNNRTTARVLLIVCSISLSIDLLIPLIRKITEKMRQRTAARCIHRTLQTLTDEQAKALRTLTSKGLVCGILPCDQESTQSLVDAGILIPEGPRFFSGEYLRTYYFSPIARQHFYGKSQPVLTPQKGQK